MPKKEHKCDLVWLAPVTCTISVEGLPRSRGTIVALKCCYAQALRALVDALEVVVQASSCSIASNAQPWAQAACIAIHSPKDLPVGARFAGVAALQDVPLAPVSMRAAVVHANAATKGFGGAGLA